MNPSKSIGQMRRRLRHWLALIVALSISACEGNVVTGFNTEAMMPLDPPIAGPAAQTGEMYPSHCTVESGHRQTGNYDYGVGTCYLHAPITAVWMALQNPKVTQDPNTQN